MSRTELRTAGIIGAAGLSRRMGSNKLVLPAGPGKTVLDRVIQAATGSILTITILVAGRWYTDDFRSSLLDPNLVVVANDSPELGMSHSLQLGLKRCVDFDGALILLGDQPLVTSEVINLLITKFWANPEKIVAPTVGSKRTNPVLFPRRFFAELLQVQGDEGGRSVLSRRQDDTVLLELTDYNDMDVDTPEDADSLNRFIQENS